MSIDINWDYAVLIIYDMSIRHCTDMHLPVGDRYHFRSD
jgi:hypothetical protein